ncbi:CocE/NonD family hydrolase [Ideonella sp. YS5]|uniref:CocE/NonD family hydrolase n=1 Tax=Ideonella sp. YS5 TaxID=3453714 RepID=UPI003EE8E4CD
MASRRSAFARSSLTVGCAMAAGAALISVPSTASAASPWVVGNRTVPYFDRALAVTETINVRTGADRDRNGTPDTIRVEITRPDTAEGDKVPVIIHASPYFFNGSRDAWETDFFVPRGYAVATVALPGTDFSTGCADVGGDREVRGTKAVIDWLNGRAEGYYLDGSQADATQWSTGKAGMIGVSWDGTIANSVAATGVKGLETIVPVAAISSWYDYTRGNGIPFYEDHVAFLNDFVSNYDSQFCRDMTPRLQKHSDDPTGNYNDFWAVRDYRLDASQMKASVFVVHGLNDENVKTRQFGEWWDELEKYGIKRRIFLHQGQHIEPYYSFGSTYTTPLLQWFDYYLQGLDNGAPKEPQAIIQREDTTWSTDKLWPPEGTADQQLKLTSPLGRLAGALTTPSANIPQGKRFLTFTQSTEYSSDSIVANPTQPRGDRLVFLTDALADKVRESGTATLTLRVKVDRPTAGFQARVVDYNGNSAFIVSRTIADLGHFKSWETKKELVPGKWYELTWEINTDDRIFAKGHNLGLVITAEKANPLIGYQPVTATVDTENSWITMPLSGSISSLAFARPLAPIVTTTVGPAGPSRDVREFVREFFEGSK